MTVGPLAPEAAPFVITLMTLALFLVTSAGAHISKWFVETVTASLRSAAHGIPYVGGRVANAIEGIGQRASNALGNIAEQADNRVGQLFWRVEHTVSGVLDELLALTVLLGLLEWYVTVKFPLAVISKAAHVAHRSSTTIVRQYPAVVKRIEVNRKTLAKLVALAVAAALAAKHLVITVHRDAATLPARVGFTWKQLRAIRFRLSRLEKATVGLGAVALVAGALARMNLRWLRCPALGRIGRNLGCGGFAILEEFLAPVFEALVVLDLCRFALGAQKLVRAFIPELGLVILAADAICLGGGASLPSAADAPRLSATIRLPTAHD